MFFGSNFNNDEFRRASKTILTVTRTLGKEISAAIEASGIDLEKLPPPGDWSQIYERYTDNEVASSVSQLSQQGWLFYDLVEFLPLTDFYHLLEQTSAADNHQALDSEMINALETALNEGTELGSFDSIISAIRNVDPVGAEKRVSYLKQILAAYKTGEMYALIPSIAYAQLESLFAKFSYQQILSNRSNAYTGIYDQQKTRKFIKDIKIPVSAIERPKDIGILLHNLFLKHLEAFETVFLQLSSSSKTHDYVTAADIEQRASIISRHYVAHGGLGVDTKTHAAKAISSLIATVFLLHRLKILKSS